MSKKVLLHVSPNVFPDIKKLHATKRIWIELAKEFDEYHLFARSSDNRYHLYTENNMFLHLVPTYSKKARSFFLFSFLTLFFVKKYKVTHLLAQCPITTGLAVNLASKIFKVPYMVEIHGMEYLNLMKREKMVGFIANKYLRFVFKDATKLRSLSSKMTELISDLKIEANVIEIPNRVDLTLFNTPKNNFEIGDCVKIISVGRFVEEKGYEFLIQAVKELPNDYDIEIDLSLIGGGRLENKYKEIIGENKNIHLYSWLSQKEIVSKLCNADIYIQSSVSEGMPRTILEAMAMRLPIISTNVGGILGVLKNNYNSIIINSNSILEIKEAIVLLTTNESKRKEIAVNGYDDVKNKYEWNKIFDLYRFELAEMEY